MRSPPTRGTNASCERWSSGPSRRIGIRLSPENSRGTLGVGSDTGDTVIVSSSITTSRPIERRMSAVMPTSPTFGALVIVDGVSAKSAATMCLVTAFFEPATTTSPRNGPLGSMCHAGPSGSTTTGAAAGSMASEATARQTPGLRRPRRARKWGLVAGRACAPTAQSLCSHRTGSGARWRQCRARRCGCGARSRRRSSRSCRRRSSPYGRPRPARRRCSRRSARRRGSRA